MTTHTAIHWYGVDITGTATKETRRYIPTLPWVFPSEEGSGSLFLWEEGNYSCDCNRARFFYGGEPGIPCGEGRFTVRCISASGEVLYDETEKLA